MDPGLINLAPKFNCCLICFNCEECCSVVYVVYIVYVIFLSKRCLQISLIYNNYIDHKLMILCVTDCLKEKKNNNIK
jgi:hypothetical protein